MKQVLRFSVLILLFLGMVYVWLTWQNNKDVAFPQKQEINAAFENAVSWLQENRTGVLDTPNPALWRMVQRSARLTGDERLQDLFDTYYKRYFSAKRQGYGFLWFQEKGWAPVTYEQIESLDDYQQFFAYALTCDADLGRQPLIYAQNDPTYCDGYPLSPSCVTHQMMGLQILRERRCGDVDKQSEVIQTLQKRVVRQITLDPRLLDPYIQRVLMLLDTGALSMVKPVWISRVMNGSLRDGGWSGKRTILDLPGKYDLIFTRNFLGLGEAKSSFHATAQALLIFALLLEHEKEVN